MEEGEGVEGDIVEGEGEVGVDEGLVMEGGVAVGRQQGIEGKCRGMVVEEQLLCLPRRHAYTFTLLHANGQKVAVSTTVHDVGDCMSQNTSTNYHKKNALYRIDEIMVGRLMQVSWKYNNIIS